MTRLACTPVLGLCCAVLAGCGGKDPYAGREALSGKVTLKGQPIKDGATVTFDPMDGQATATLGLTAGGAYRIARENGLLPGKYLVRVSLGDGKTAVNPVDPGAPPGPGGGANIISKELVPADWNTRSKQQVTVTAGGPNSFDFAIP